MPQPQIHMQIQRQIQGRTSAPELPGWVERRARGGECEFDLAFCPNGVHVRTIVHVPTGRVARGPKPLNSATQRR